MLTGVPVYQTADPDPSSSAASTWECSAAAAAAAFLLCFRALFGAAFGAAFGTAAPGAVGKVPGVASKVDGLVMPGAAVLGIEVAGSAAGASGLRGGSECSGGMGHRKGLGGARAQVCREAMLLRRKVGDEEGGCVPTHSGPRSAQ